MCGHGERRSLGEEKLGVVERESTGVMARPNVGEFDRNEIGRSRRFGRCDEHAHRQLFGLAVTASESLSIEVVELDARHGLSARVEGLGVAVDTDDLARDVAAIVRDEEHDQITDLLRIDIALHRCADGVHVPDSLRVKALGASVRGDARSMRSPLTLPGTMPLTRMLSGPSSIASVSVKPAAAHLAATYGDRPGKPMMPAPEIMLMMTPLCWALKTGAAASAVNCGRCRCSCSDPTPRR